MVEISFYHLTSSPVERALPKLLEKVIAVGNKVVVNAPTQENIEQLDKVLWSYSSKAFLAHGTSKDAYPDMQPIYLTANNDNPNGAKVLAIVGGMEPVNINEFERCIDMFDGSDEEEVTKARMRWNKYKNEGFKLVYWQQNSSGNWENQKNT